MVVLYTVTLFTSAALLFVLEPLVGKLLLPRLGGTAAVWTTCLVFFQAMLLVGYLIAHVLPVKLGVRRHAVLHLGLALLPLVVLPLRPTEGWSPPADQPNPVLWLLGLLLVTVGPPFVIVATTAPLLQRWLADTRHPSARDPYFLYAASNAGSLLALLAYPLLLEPLFPVGDQCEAWRAGYLVFLGLLTACAGWLWLTPRAEPATAAEPSSPPPGTAERRSWLLLSAVPSSLLLGMTAYLTTDLAAMPLLWLVPLTLYLLSFVLVFAPKPLIPHSWVVQLLPPVALLVLIVFGLHIRQPLWAVMGLHLAYLFVGSLYCHGELARRRPATPYLTGFYLRLSAGGVLGGLFNAVVAPSVLPAAVEYPLAIAAACLLLPGPRRDLEEPGDRAGDFQVPLAVGAGWVGLRWLTGSDDTEFAQVVALWGYCGLAYWCYTTVRRPVRFGLSLAVVLLLGECGPALSGRLLFSGRSFFGVHQVLRDATGATHLLKHGNTVHGSQRLDGDHRSEPTLYFDRRGPLGQVFESLPAETRRAPVGVVGLGAGTTACYCLPGQRLDYFEIDPVVQQVAENPAFFTYLRDAAARGVRYRVLLGDGRLGLARQPEGAYGLLFLDAFSSDAVPAHLLTREAVERVYLPRLVPGGVLVFQCSNRYLDIEPVLGDLAGAAGLVCAARDDAGALTDEDRADGRVAAHYVVMARSAGNFGPLMTDPRWHPVRPRPDARPWTDEYTNLYDVISGR